MLKLVGTKTLINPAEISNVRMVGGNTQYEQPTLEVQLKNVSVEGEPYYGGMNFSTISITGEDAGYDLFHVLAYSGYLSNAESLNISQTWETLYKEWKELKKIDDELPF